MTPPRLHVITAQKCSKAVILRRGPAKQVATIGWDRNDNTFQMGQWLKNRIYPHRSDLSPDGKHLIYFAFGGPQTAYTAVSRAPWLKALAFLPQDSTYYGGGAFAPDGAVWLNGGGKLPDTRGELAQSSDQNAYPHGTDGFHMGDLYAAMQKQRGWTHVSGSSHKAILAKPVIGDWSLELSFAIAASNRSIISNRYALMNRNTSQSCQMDDWEWADIWQGKLQFASRGSLFEIALSPHGELRQEKCIRDFSSMSFREIIAPYDATSEQAVKRGAESWHPLDAEKPDGEKS